MGNLIFEGKSIEEALEKAVNELGVNRDELQYEVLEEGSKSIFKMFSKKYKIQVTLNQQTEIKDRINAMFEDSNILNSDNDESVTKKNSKDVAVGDKRHSRRDFEPVSEEVKEEIINEAKKFVEEFFNFFNIKVRTDHRVHREKVTLLIFTQGDYIETKNFEEFIYSLKYLLNKIMIGKYNANLKFDVDINEYIKKKTIKLKQLAKEISEKVKSEHKSIKLRPMYPNERRIVHITLKNDRNIKTESVGNGARKRVLISPAAE